MPDNILAMSGALTSAATTGSAGILSPTRRIQISNCSIVFLTLLISACAAPEILAPRNGTVPDGVNLSGNWQIIEDESDGQRRLREAIRSTDGVRDGDLRRPQASGDRRQRVRGGLVYVFLETGRSLKVTQTPYGLFISFDRSVVEEFRFGERRTINVGAVEAQRVAGWEGNELVVETLDRNGMKLTERFGLAESGNLLVRKIVLRSKSGDQETLTQHFERRPG